MALTDSLVSYYKLDSNSSDSVGSNNGTDTAISYANAGIIGNDATLNGTSSRITSGTTGFPTGSSAGTISLWVKVAAQPSTSQMYLYMYGAFSNNACRILYYGDSGGTKSIGFAGYNADISYNTTLTTGSWFHIVGVYDGTNSSLYLNGTLVVGPTAKTFNTSSGSTAIFGSTPTPTSYLNGYLDEVGIWSRALTSTEITTLYNAGAGVQYPFTTGNPGAFFQFFN